METKANQRASSVLPGFAVLGGAAKPAIPALIGMLEGTPSGPHWQALAVGTNLHMAHDAAFALALIGKDAWPALLDLAASTNETLRVKASVSFAYVRDTEDAPEFVAWLDERLRGGNETTAAAAAFALKDAGMEPDRVVSALTNALNDPRPSVRASAVTSLGGLGGACQNAEAGFRCLRRALSDRDAAVRTSATNALSLFEILMHEAGANPISVVERQEN
jgi:HEAT repeat protein